MAKEFTYSCKYLDTTKFNKRRGKVFEKNKDSKILNPTQLLKIKVFLTELKKCLVNNS